MNVPEVDPVAPHVSVFDDAALHAQILVNAFVNAPVYLAIHEGLPGVAVLVHLTTVRGETDGDLLHVRAWVASGHDGRIVVVRPRQKGEQRADSDNRTQRGNTGPRLRFSSTTHSQ